MYYYILLSDLLIRIITIFVITLLLHIKSLLHIITSLLHHYYQWHKQVIMSSLLHIMHFQCFHYYIVITHYCHYYP